MITGCELRSMSKSLTCADDYDYRVAYSEVLCEAIGKYRWPLFAMPLLLGKKSPVMAKSGHFRGRGTPRFDYAKP